MITKTNFKQTKYSLHALIGLVTISLLASCSSTGRYQQHKDSTPTRLPTQAEQKDAIARAEPYSRGGNKDYQVLGKHYKVLTDTNGFEQEGIASWYGEKFHGHLTSNGEIYDMYAMSAAHKSLPLPTYLKVTNLVNNKSVIVRVNDRGPFHQSRIIDLSYSAAYKLDMLKTGTAKVKITAITDFSPKKAQKEKQQSSQASINSTYIQVFATSKVEVAQSTAAKLTKQYNQTVKYPEHQGIYRIQIGPINNLTTLNKLLKSLKENGYPSAYPRQTVL
ncbi:septal ring lytic transglycosylase RlpA family protein [Litorilituus lipolyticus]|uniref:Endolytic peptidoglycan transglycosylase RlpA n=1 Tax=Litorilituus lipolyticus TaxID=2491017 RepID=A0A502KYD7_9GAMM|nr:septal ring lytic transglycosylase RlpA family protein [Litorilituus lipolyticus]TPH14683.1 septal ring lytic transglycosylase RlpA family protein [Litorilituus lipolyticus]